MKIAYVVTSIGNSGGMERVISTKANYFADHLGYEVHIVLASDEKETPFFTFSEKIHFHYLGIKLSAKKPWTIFSLTKEEKRYQTQLETCLRLIKADIVIGLMGRETPFLYRLKDGSTKVLEFHYSKRYLIHLGNALVNTKSHFLKKAWLRLLTWREEQLAKKYDYIVLLTEKDKNLWGGGEKFKVIPNPLSFTFQEAARLENKQIVGMGRLMPQKGFDLLIPAFKSISDQFPDWKLYVYGDGQDKEYLNKLIKNLSLQEQVLIKPPTKEVKQVLLESSLFVFPSRYEGFGLVLTEAMECGVPCVAFDCECGPSDIIRNGEDGFLVPLGDIELLAERMKMLMLDADLRRLLGKRAKQNVQRFHVTIIMNEWDGYFKSLLNQR